MARDRVRIWYDVKGDYLEVLFDERPGYFRETANDQETCSASLCRK